MKKNQISKEVLEHVTSFLLEYELNTISIKKTKKGPFRLELEKVEELGGKASVSKLLNSSPNQNLLLKIRDGKVVCYHQTINEQLKDNFFG